MPLTCPRRRPGRLRSLHEQPAIPDAGRETGKPGTNPAARERGEVRVGDDGSVTWEYFGKLDEAGVSKILDEITNALRATGVRFLRQRPPS